MRKRPSNLFRLAAYIMILCLITALLQEAVPRAFAAKIGTRFIRISTSIASLDATHFMGINYGTLSDPVGSVAFEYCTNDPIPHTACIPPSGLDVTTAVLIDQLGEIGYTIHPNTTQNRLVISRPATVPVTSNSSYEFETIRNPDTPGSYYVRIYTYASEDGTGTSIDDGGMVFAITRALSIATEVPPFLLFCTAVTISNVDCNSASDFLISLGELSSSQTKTGTSEMVVATNADFGYSITISGTTLTSGNNVIDPLALPASSAVGVSQYGLNLRANTNPAVGAEPTGVGTGVPVNGYGVVNQYKFNSGDVIISSTDTSNRHKFTVSYIVNIDNAQEAGVYATTMTYIALGNF